jgi:hypothetical protein
VGLNLFPVVSLLNQTFGNIGGYFMHRHTVFCKLEEHLFFLNPIFAISI